MSNYAQLRESILAELKWEPGVNAAYIGVIAKNGVVASSRTSILFNNGRARKSRLSRLLTVGKRAALIEKVPPRITDKPLDFAFVVALAGAAEPIDEQVVRLQLAEHPRPLALAIAQNAGNRDHRVVIQIRHRHAAKE